MLNRFEIIHLLLVSRGLGTIISLDMNSKCEVTFHCNNCNIKIYSASFLFQKGLFIASWNANKQKGDNSSTRSQNGNGLWGILHHDIIKWKHFPRYRTFMGGGGGGGVSRSPVDSPERQVTQSFDVVFDLHLNKGLNKQSRRWWVDTPSRSLWRYCNVVVSCRSFQKLKTNSV